MTNKAKGPAEAATSPSHGPSKSGKEFDMNDTTSTTLKANMPAPLIHQISEIDFGRCNMRELRAVYDALRLAEAALSGIINQPRFVTERTLALNPAGALIDTFHSHTIEMIDVLVAYAKGASVKSVDEVESRAWIILHHEATCSDDLSRFVVLAAQQNLALDDAEFDAKRVGGRS